MIFGKYVNRYYLKYGLFLLLGAIALVAVDYFQLEIPDIIGDVIDNLEYKTLTTSALKEYVLKLVMIAGIMFTGRFLWRVTLFSTGIKIECDIRNKLYRTMLSFSQTFFSNHKTGELMANYTNDLSMIRQTFGMGTVMLVDALCLGVLALYRMFSLNALLSIICLTSLIIITVLSSIVGKKITKATEDNFNAYGALSDYVQEDYSGINVVKAFVKEDLKVKLFKSYNNENMNTTLVMTKLSLTLNICISTILSMVKLLILMYGGYLVFLRSTGSYDGFFTIGTLTKFTAYFGSLIWPIEAIGRLIDMHSKGRASLNRVTVLLDEIKEINDDLVTENTKDIDVLEGKIEYRGLSFRYPETNENSQRDDILKDINLTINKGEFVGIMGETGTGKSTLVELLLRIYNVNEKTLFIDDVDIMTIPLKAIRTSISYVPQDNFLFGDTINNNIAFSEKGNIDYDKIKEVARIANVDKDIEEFANGYETILGERGVTVSGGQKQRLAIARALYRNSPILILDDSLSAVDTETEKGIIESLRKIRKGKTTIIIAHRITTLQNLDKIVVVCDGKINAVGKHDELLETCEAYQKEVHLQELERMAGEYDE